MDILEIIEDLNKKHKNKEIIEFIENLDEEEKTPQIISLLARAYNNIIPLDKNNKQNYRYAIKLLDSVKDELEDDANWNFRKAYAHYYLDQEGYARLYFQKALEKNPIDKDAKGFIYICDKVLVAPCRERNFRNKVKVCWEEFENNEQSIRKMMEQENNKKKVQEYISSILSIAFTNIRFEAEKTGDRFCLRLLPYRKKLILLQYLYFKARAPESVSLNWDILIGNDRDLAKCREKISGEDIGFEDIYYRLKNVNISGFDIDIYCEKLNKISNMDEQEKMHFLKRMLDRAIGESQSIVYINEINLTNGYDKRFNSLDRLYEKMKVLNINLDINSESISENVVLYDMDPIKDAQMREDITVGVCYSTAILREYRNYESGIMNYFQADGIVPGFLSYPIEKVSVQDYSKKVLDLREEMKQIIINIIGKDAITFIGEATGVNMGYIDFIAWDLSLVLYGIKKMFDYINIEYVVFQTFRKDVNHILIKNKNSYTKD